MKTKKYSLIQKSDPESVLLLIFSLYSGITYPTTYPVGGTYCGINYPLAAGN